VDVNWRAVVAGAIAGLVVIVVLALALNIVTNGPPEDWSGGWLAVAVVGFLGSCLLAGYRSAIRAPGLAYSHGALGALGAVLLWTVISLVRDAVTSHTPKWGGIFMSALFAVSLGIVGGALAQSRARQQI